MTKHPEGLRPPVYGAPLSGQPFTYEGVIFRPYRRGISLYSRVSDDFRIEIYGLYQRPTYVVFVDGVRVEGRFRSQETAARAGIKASKLIRT